MSEWVAGFAGQHPVLFTVLFVPVLTGVLNTLIRYFKSKDWDTYQAAHPRVAALLKISKAWGFEPVGGLMQVYTLFTGRPWSDGGSGGSGGSGSSEGGREDASAATGSPGKGESRRQGMLFGVPVSLLLPKAARVIYAQALLAAALVVAFVATSSCYDMQHPPAYPDEVIFPEPDGCVTGVNCPSRASRPESAKSKKMSPEDCAKLASGETWAAGFGYGGAIGTVGLGGVAGYAGLEKGTDKTALAGLAIGTALLGGLTLVATVVARGKAVQYVGAGCAESAPVPPPPMPLGSAAPSASVKP